VVIPPLLAACSVVGGPPENGGVFRVNLVRLPGTRHDGNRKIEIASLIYLRGRFH